MLCSEPLRIHSNKGTGASPSPLRQCSRSCLQRYFDNIQISQRCTRIHSSASDSPSVATGSVTWDPEGLLGSSIPEGGHFARRQQQNTLSAITPVDPHFLVEHPIKKIPKGHKNGIRPSELSLSGRKTYEKILQQKYMPVDLNMPGAKILNFDPPIITFDNFWNEEECNAMIECAKASGKMQQSKVGSGNLASSSMIIMDGNRRTSSSLLIDAAVQNEVPGLKTHALRLQERAKNLLQGDCTGVWGEPGLIPKWQQFCFEALQVTEYRTGQFFREHEDAFPVEIAEENKFQRHATVLLYLNGVSEGGSTKFEHLNLEVQPEQGKVLIFFPAFADGTPDQRTLHTAVDARDVKWVSQQWVARGFSQRKATELAAKQEKAFDALMSKRVKSRRKGNSTVKSKGFAS